MIYNIGSASGTYSTGEISSMFMGKDELKMVSNHRTTSTEILQKKT